LFITFIASVRMATHSHSVSSDEQSFKNQNHDKNGSRDSQVEFYHEGNDPV